MKTGRLALALALSILVLSSASEAADISDPGAERYANNIMTGFVTPTVKPGMTVDFSFNITNPYDNALATMQNLTFYVGVYKYSTQDTSRVVDQNFSHPPNIDGLGPEVVAQLDPVYPGETTRIVLHITTSHDTPHGSYFSQSTYFMRFRLTFNFPSNTTLVVLQSRGYFTDEQWNQMVSFAADQPIVNKTYMHELGVDGLLPDSAFGLKVPIPRWPLAVIVAVIVLLSVSSLYYYVLDNPGKYPRLEKRFYYLRGKLRELRSKLQDRRRK